MQPPLADFRIENDNVVWLAFRDGRTYRVSPSELHTVLSREDVKRVRAALGMRSQFLRRVLPPTAMVILAVSALGLGVLDYRQLRLGSGLHAAQPVASSYHQARSPGLPIAPATTQPAPPPVQSAPPQPVVAKPAPAAPAATAKSAVNPHRQGVGHIPFKIQLGPLAELGQ